MTIINGKNYFEYNEIEDAEYPVFTIGDIQLEARLRIGRQLTDAEIDEITGCLKWDVGESLNITYASAFQDL
jgi:hypothetical protein